MPEVTTIGRLRKRASSASTVRNASTTRGVKPSASTMPSISRVLRCFAAASMLERADHAHAFAECHGKRRIGAAAADQENGRVAGGNVDAPGRAAAGSSRRITVACKDRTISAARSAPAGDRNYRGLRKGNGAFGQRFRDRPRSAADKVRGPRSLRQRIQGGLVDAGRRDQNRGRLQLLDGARCIGPAASITGNMLASSSAVANDGRPAVETTMIGPCWDI